jgi:glycosyltransferase involved in cell wall biosynthesis
VRVALDVSPLAQTRAGTARYLRGLVPELEVTPGIELRRLVFAGSTKLATLARDTAWYVVGLPRAAARGRADVLHCPTFRGPFRSRVPLVVTVHDLAVLRRPEAFNRWTRSYSRIAVPLVVRAARRIVAVSEFTRRELVDVLGVADEKIRVVSEAAAPVFGPAGSVAGGDYVLAVGTLEPRKNLPRLIDAARRLGVELRVAGERGWGGVEVARDGVVWLGRVTDDELAALYRGALCVAYPSLYEGFGLPVLEAMACGAPVVTSAGGASEEVAADAAVLVDPLDTASIAAGIEQAVARRAELTRRGLERARHFSWRAAAARTVAVYREVCE